MNQEKFCFIYNTKMLLDLFVIQTWKYYIKEKWYLLIAFSNATPSFCNSLSTK